MSRRLIFFIAVFSLVAIAGAEEQTATYSILGLASPDRVEDFREHFKEVANAQLESVDFDRGECTVRFDFEKLYPGSNPDNRPAPEEVMRRFSDRLNGLSRGMFKLKPLSALPRDKQERLDLKIGLLDCKACRLGAYYAIANVEGVEQVSVTAAGDQITVWIDPAKTSRDPLVAALKNAGVDFQTP